MNYKKPILSMYVILVVVFLLIMAGVLFIIQANMNPIWVVVVLMGALGILAAMFNRFIRKFSDTFKELSDKAASLDILKSVLDALDIFIYITDIRTDELIFVNKSLMAHFDWADSVIGEPCWKVFQTGFSGRCDYCSLNKLLHHADMEGKPVIWEAYNTITGRYYRNIDRIIDWPDGKKVHFCQRIDMTEKKSLEDEMRGVLERAEQANRAKSDFLSRMSHEMRTPMNIIIGMANLGQKAKGMDEIRQHLTTINSAASHLLDIINDILDMSKIEAGKMKLSETHFRFREMMEQIAAAMTFKASEKQQTFLIKTDENVPEFLVTDKRKLMQVIINLLSNAIKFTQEGGHIGLSVHKAEESGGRCKLLVEVEDDGIGIPQEEQEKIFDIFEQMDSTITRQYEGAGLGLAISKNMISIMGGELWVESEPDKGAVFRFTIDAGVGDSGQEDEKDSQKLKEEDLINIFAGKHILLADDMQINRDILAALLDSTGVLIDCAENGQEACDKFAADPGRYDLIFMDIHMPEMDGYEVTRKIRRMEGSEAAAVPIIAMTADVFSGDVEKCLEAGMNDHIGKPLEMDIVINKMKAHLL